MTWIVVVVAGFLIGALIHSGKWGLAILVAVLALGFYLWRRRSRG